jgi:hypothetical protein
MGIYDKYNNLRKAEKDFLAWHPLAALDFNSNANTALAEAQKRFSRSSLHNGSGDAFRHCFWSAMNARDQGEDLAKQFGDAHEDFLGNPEAEKKMDLHNNQVGYGIGRYLRGATDRHIAVLCVQAWAMGKLIQIDKIGGNDLVYSNSYEDFLYKP